MNNRTKFKLIGIGIQNFRIFKNYQYFDLKPLTILTGTNNAGKSTLGKAILLLRNSWEQNKFNSLFLDVNKEVLGTFGSNLPYHSNDETIKFKLVLANDNQRFELDLHYTKNRLAYFKLADTKGTLASCSYNYDIEGALKSYRKSFMRLNDNFLNTNRLKSYFSITNDDLLNKLVKSILNNLQNNAKLHFSDYPYAFILTTISPIKAFFEGFCENIRNELIEDEVTLANFINTDLFEFFTPEDLRVTIYEFINKGYDPEKQLPKNWLEYSMFDINICYQEINLNSIIYRKSDYPKLYESLTAYKKDIFNENIQNILYHWIVGVMKLVRPSSRKHNDKKIEFIKIVEAGEWGDILKIKILSVNEWVDLSSLGYGASNLILKILQLVLNNKLMLIEEPESNLHPSLQSKLADFIVHTSVLNYNLGNTFGMSYESFGGRRIIETHSEYFIRRLQYLVASEQSPLTSDDVQIYYFNNPLEEQFEVANQVIDIKILPNGTLSNNFGSGFMDEADKIALDLYLLKYK